mmetsp:Transcript_1097/g.2389  ORF Transcript_1097/g.2389 Transcript_1097/m.2389 type:complete len:218 (-) Transcript_1097:752-1405(-)
MNCEPSRQLSWQQRSRRLTPRLTPSLIDSSSKLPRLLLTLRLSTRRPLSLLQPRPSENKSRLSPPQPAASRRLPARTLRRPRPRRTRSCTRRSTPQSPSASLRLLRRRTSSQPRRRQPPHRLTLCELETAPLGLCRQILLACNPNSRVHAMRLLLCGGSWKLISARHSLPSRQSTRSTSTPWSQSTWPRPRTSWPSSRLRLRCWRRTGSGCRLSLTR